MARIVQSVGLPLLLPVVMIFARYAAVPFGRNPGQVSALFLLYGGYFILAAYAISFVAVGYQFSKYRVGTILQAGALCAFAYVILNLFASILWKLVSGMFGHVSTEFEYIALIVAHLVGASLLGAAGFLWHARMNTAPND